MEFCGNNFFSFIYREFSMIQYKKCVWAVLNMNRNNLQCAMPFCLFNINFVYKYDKLNETKRYI
jgi:hypothetical protein